MKTQTPIIIIILLIVIALFGWGLIRDESSINNPPEINDNSLPPDWTYQSSTICQVDLPLPPQTETYTTDRGEYWRFQENPQSNQFFTHNAVVILQNPELGGSGYIAGAVIVSCQPNTENLSSTELASSYADYLATQGASAPAEAQITLNINRTTRLWGENVVVASLAGGLFNPAEEIFIVATPTTNYVIAKPAHSTDDFVRTTTNQIFEGLKLAN
ncbi:MAG: hypothetical protein A2589_02675 [Candidatus Vogelbacteria bacterium RIFOXYD1_FULL_46_19]|uniref:PsbP C-terminal domain-containing protein n=1 Tax=Candidatus Vogelbacteria bacterium RIFOXYD1_FULL_46_19 TaxID=1802439 RepID=A0A1G2QHM4_9BACT|nr:MAG: hypothetical protein A2589_02675 [Candidatus Vogelbacteria bacterium RIFOXYD1_FULL_46_19]